MYFVAHKLLLLLCTHFNLCAKQMQYIIYTSVLPFIARHMRSFQFFFSKHDIRVEVEELFCFAEKKNTVAAVVVIIHCAITTFAF